MSLDEEKEKKSKLNENREAAGIFSDDKEMQAKGSRQPKAKPKKK